MKTRSVVASLFVKSGDNMKTVWKSLAFVMLVATSACAQIDRPAFDPSQLKGPSGSNSQLLVLGTLHLSGLPVSFNTANLSSLLDRLAAWKPQEIAVEVVSGVQCEFMRRYPERYRDSVEAYCSDPAPARAAIGLDVWAATAEAEHTLSHWEAAPEPDQRRRLAAVFLAGGEEGSALVQWLRLSPTERHSGNGLNDVLVARLEVLLSSRNESTSIAAQLASNLGLERLYSIDDHTADTSVADEAAYDATMTKVWNNPAASRRKALDDKNLIDSDTPAGVLSLYRALNAPPRSGLVYQSDFGAAMVEPSVEKFGRFYVGYWETRNLRMASNIREMMGAHPGERALVIVGESHKGYLEAYLNMMHDIAIQNVSMVLEEHAVVR